MAIAHISFNKGTEHGRLLAASLRSLESAVQGLNEIKATMALMVDGDGAEAAHFAYMQERFGFTDDRSAKAAWEELNSLLFKVNTNASVADVNAAMLQAFAKFR